VEGTLECEQAHKTEMNKYISVCIQHMSATTTFMAAAVALRFYSPSKELGDVAATHSRPEQ
jgi:hypothetical protein